MPVGDIELAFADVGIFPERTNNVQKWAKKISPTINADDIASVEMLDSKRFMLYRVISSDNR